MNAANLGLGNAYSWQTPCDYIPGLDFITPAPPPPPPLPDSEPPKPEQPSEPELLATEPEKPENENRDVPVDTEATHASPALPSDEEDDLDEEEDLLRAQLLQSLVQKRQAKLDAEVSVGRRLFPWHHYDFIFECKLFKIHYICSGPISW